jgi:hypothetical protein
MPVPLSLPVGDADISNEKPMIETLIKAGVLHERARFASQLKAFNIQQIGRMAFANKNFKVAYPAMFLWHMTDALSKLVSWLPVGSAVPTLTSER